MNLQPLLLTIAVAITAILLAALGRRLPIPTAILQVLGGLLVAFVPGASVSGILVWRLTVRVERGP